MVVGGYAPTRILLDEADHGVRHVGILQRDLISGQLDVHRGQRIVEMVELSRADDRRGDHRLCQQPGERDLSARDATGVGNHGHPIDHLAVRLFGFSEQPGDRLIGFGADAGVVPVAAQLAARLWARWNDADTFRRAQRQHLPLLLAIEQVDEVLHADETGPAVAFGDAEGAGELPCVH